MKLKYVVCLSLLFSLSPVALAQPGIGGEVGRLERTNASAPGFFYKFEGNQPLITVSTVGAVSVNAVFLVGEGSTMTEVLTLAGGVTVDRTGSARVRLHRQGAMVSEVEIRDLYADGAAPPVLQDGDVIEVVGLVSSVSGFYVHSEPGSDTIPVTASGAFAAPGRYELDTGSSVGDLVAYAGGLGTVGVRDSRTDVTATVRVYRAGEVILESPLSELYAQQTMILQSGDAVDLEVITKQRGSFWRDALSVTTAVLSAAVLIERLTTGR